MTLTIWICSGSDDDGDDDGIGDVVVDWGGWSKKIYFPFRWTQFPYDWYTLDIINIIINDLIIFIYKNNNIIIWNNFNYWWLKWI